MLPIRRLPWIILEARALAIELFVAVLHAAKSRVSKECGRE
jgi:hypothetical protein